MNTRMTARLMNLLAIFLLLGTPAAIAGDKHEHKKKTAGPNGGRILTAVEPHAEFLITAGRKVQITFLGEDGKPVAPSGQAVSVTAGERSAPTKLTFTVSGNSFVSEQALPAGDLVPTVIQIKTSPDAKSVVEKLNVNLEICGGCKLAEYACTCAEH